MTGFEWLPKETCGLHLTHNENRSCYRTVARELECRECEPSWPSPEERQRAIDTDEIWELQWYPDTPVGFYNVAAASLEALREFVLTATWRGKTD